MTITNARLEAILQRHPGLRPKDGANELCRDADSAFVCEWYWYSTSKHNCRDVHQAEANAMIFRAMCEALPDCDGCFRGSEAFEHLCKYWEAR